MKNIILVLACTIFLTGCISPRVSSIRDSEKTISPTTTLEVSISSSKFIPESISINAGDTITIKNRDAKSYTLLSDPHPTHSQIPSLYKVIYKDETASITFSNPGDYGMHIEENPSISLQVMVK